MKAKDFENSKWMKDAATPEGEVKVRSNYSQWSKRVNNPDLKEKATSLWQHLCSGKIGTKEKLMVIGALLYLISPIDMIPDVIPVLGWLDDIGVAAYVLSYLVNKISHVDQENEIINSSTLEQISQSEHFTKRINLPTTDYDFDNLKDIASKVGNVPVHEILVDIESSLYDCVGKVALVGRYSTGKSTLINALLQKNLLPTHTIPTTSAITYVSHADKQSIFSVDEAGTISQHASLDELTKNKHSQVDEINILTPLANWKGVTLIDTPGLEDTDQARVALTYELIPKLDAIVLVLDAGYGMSKVESDFIQSLLTSDRERKLVVVVNRSDKKNADELEEMVQGIKEDLSLINCVPEQFHVLSSKRAIQGSDVAFENFRKNLFEFIGGGLSQERKRIAEARILQVRENLKVSCQQALIITAKEEDEQQEILVSMQEKRDRITQELVKQKEEVCNKVDRMADVFRANFGSFKTKMSAEMSRLIDSSTLPELRKGTIVEEFATQNIRTFVEEELGKVHTNLEAVSDQIMHNMRLAIQEVNVTMQVESSESFFEANKTIIVSSMIAISYPFVGLFSFIEIFAVGMLGRSVFESIFTALGEKVAIKKIREELKEVSDKKLTEIMKGVEGKVADHFNMIKVDLCDSLEQAVNIQLPTFEQPSQSVKDKSISFQNLLTQI